MNLFSQIEEVVPKLDGWCTVEKAKLLAAWVMALRPSQSIEIGVWGGKSLLPMALAHKEIGAGLVLGIDPWSPQAGMEGQAHPDDRKFWGRDANYNQVYQTLVENINTLELKKHVQIARKRSDEVVPPNIIDLIHIDGNHGPQVIKDVERYCTHIRVGGVVILDDVNWTGGAGVTASNKLLTMGFVNLYPVPGHDGSVFQKVR